MADFCKQCSIVVWGKDMKDLAGLSTEEDTKAGLYCSALCEDCGWIQVDHEGSCVTHEYKDSHGFTSTGVMPKV